MNTTKLQVIRQGNTVILVRKCPFCGAEIRKGMDAKEFDDGIELYENGVRIQDAFPNTDESTRELIMTGICDKCFDSI